MIIGLLGFADAGKTTSANVLKHSFSFQERTFAGPLKDTVSAVFGWPRHLLEGDTLESRKFREQRDEFWSTKFGKDITPRSILQYVGTEVFRNSLDNNIWINVMEKSLEDRSKDYVITDVRFPNEMEFIVKIGGFLVEVDRNRPPAWLPQFYSLWQNYTGNFTEFSSIMNTLAHPSEWMRLTANIPTNYIIHNTGTLDDLAANVWTMVRLFNGPDEKSVKNQKLLVPTNFVC